MRRRAQRRIKIGKRLVDPLRKRLAFNASMQIAAVHINDRPVDEGRRGGGEEKGGADDLIEAAEPGMGVRSSAWVLRSGLMLLSESSVMK